jgi:hypothetical protein
LGFGVGKAKRWSEDFKPAPRQEEHPALFSGADVEG